MEEVQNVTKVALENAINHEEDELLTTQEVAQMLKCSAQVVRILANQGKLPHYNVNCKKKLYSKKGVLLFLKRQHKIVSAQLATNIK